jgi:acyl carrier protein
MSVDEVQEKVFRVAADVFNLPVAQITAASSPETIETWDSLQHLNLVLSLEGALGVQFLPEDIERIKSLGDTVTIAREKLADR